MSDVSRQTSQHTLQDRLEVLQGQGKVMSQREATNIVQDVLNGLTQLHQIGQVHGSVSPPTVVRTVTGWRLLQPNEIATSQLGAYISPERAHSGKPSLRDDVYAIGKLMLTLMAGGRNEVLSTFPDGLQEIIIKCTSQDPRWRYDTAGMVALAIKSLSRARATHAGRLILKGAGGLTGLAALIAVGSIVISLITGQVPGWWPEGMKVTIAHAARSLSPQAAATPALVWMSGDSGPQAQSSSTSGTNMGDQMALGTSSGGNGSVVGETPFGNRVGGYEAETPDADLSQEGAVIDGGGDLGTAGSVGNDGTTGELGNCVSSGEPTFFISGDGHRVESQSDLFSINYGEPMQISWGNSIGYTITKVLNGKAIETFSAGPSGEWTIDPETTTTYQVIAVGCNGTAIHSNEWTVTPLLRHLEVDSRLIVHDYDCCSPDEESPFKDPRPYVLKDGQRSKKDLWEYRVDQVKAIIDMDASMLERGKVRVKGRVALWDDSESPNNIRRWQDFEIDVYSGTYVELVVDVYSQGDGFIQGTIRFTNEASLSTNP